MGDPTFDLANFAVNHGFSEAQDRVLREACSGEASSAGLALLRPMKIMSDFREAMGRIVQIGISRLDFRGCADGPFQRLRDGKSDPGWQHWLQEA